MAIGVFPASLVVGLVVLALFLAGVVVGADVVVRLFGGSLLSAGVSSDADSTSANCSACRRCSVWRRAVDVNEFKSPGSASAAPIRRVQ